MHIQLTLVSCIIWFQMGVLGELSPSSCSLLRTAASISNIVPEVVKIAMRYYRVSSSTQLSAEHHRQKRFLFDDNVEKNSGLDNIKASLLEQMATNAFKNVNFTAVAISLLNSNETVNKIRQNVQSDAIIRAAMRNIDYEKLGRSLWYAAEAEFNFEDLMRNIVNITRMNLVHEELRNNGTLPDWFIKSIHPNLNVQTVHRMLEEMKSLGHKFVTIMNSTKDLDDYLFNMVQENILTPMGKTIQKIKDEKPATLDQLVDIILYNANKIITERLTEISKPITMDETRRKSSPSVIITTSDDENYDDVKLFFYQCAIAVDSMGQTMRIMFKAFEQLYCATIWD
ncbi:unnamed protein product [Rotaria socialis]|uniref:Uncharacterized protein n=1 Tax=Rotaria socialis TaxID=392032 RepID=A0A821EQ03_9BILA|nr:unnamed protein product [Rotaria socialis]CAF4639340.1 unnamed protein product [Rotaria socialis]